MDALSLDFAIFPPISGVVFGSDDFCASIGATRTNDAQELLYARQKVVLISKAFQLQAIDLVHIDYKDYEGMVLGIFATDSFTYVCLLYFSIRLFCSRLLAVLIHSLALVTLFAAHLQILYVLSYSLEFLNSWISCKEGSFSSCKQQ